MYIGENKPRPLAAMLFYEQEIAVYRQPDPPPMWVNLSERKQ